MSDAWIRAVIDSRSAIKDDKETEEAVELFVDFLQRVGLEAGHRNEEL